MDTLVAQYSRPMFENEGYDQQEQQELYQTPNSLSLTFAKPPVAQVRVLSFFSRGIPQLSKKRYFQRITY